MVLTIFFDDIKGSTALKEDMVGSQSEQAFHSLRHEHDELMQEVICRDGGGQIVKSTGDGVLAVFLLPSRAVEAAMEIQERLHGHRLLSVRIGIDMGEVQVDWEGDRVKDVFGRHVDWAARTEAMGDGGHICVTKPVYTDAFSWITKNRVAWKEQGQYHVKPGEPPLEVFEPYNANLVKPMDELHGERTIGPVAAAAPAGSAGAAPPVARPIRVTSSAEGVGQDVKAFAERGAGIMYWFKAPLGDICYPEGFANFVLPALANPRITKLRFVVDRSNLAAPRIWQQSVFSQIQAWAASERKRFRLSQKEGGGSYVEDGGGPKSIQWVFRDLAGEPTTFTLLLPDPGSDVRIEPAAQIFLSTATRSVRVAEGGPQNVRVSESVMSLTEPENPSLFQALTGVTNQLVSLFP